MPNLRPQSSDRFALIPGAIFACAVNDGLTLAERWVLAAILLCTNWNTGKTWPKVKRLMELTGLSEGTVTSAKTRLRSLGYIACEWRAAKGGGQVIHVLFDKKGNPRTVPCQIPRAFPANVPHRSLPNPPAKQGALPTGDSSSLTGVQSQEHRQRTESKGPDFFSDCKRLKNGKERQLLSTAFSGFQASTSGGEYLGDKDVIDVWSKVQQEVKRYHETRVHRKLPCDYFGCVELPASKIAALGAHRPTGLGPIRDPIAYLISSLADAIPHEEDRAQHDRAEQARSRRGGGLSTPNDFLKALPGNPG